MKCHGVGTGAEQQQQKLGETKPLGNNESERSSKEWIETLSIIVAVLIEVGGEYVSVGWQHQAELALSAPSMIICLLMSTGIYTHLSAFRESNHTGLSNQKPFS